MDRDSPLPAGTPPPAAVPKTAIVTGATGIQGRALLEVLEHSRRPLDFSTRAQHMRLDLTDRDAVAKAFKDNRMNLAQEVYVFHLAFSGNMTNLDRSVAVMLENTVEGLEQANAPLRHVYFTLGLKHYGVHWGATKAPFDEDDPRHLPPNYYYDLEVIATYGAVCKQLGIAMRFPGTEKAYHALTECVDARLLMKAAIYTATHYEAANNSYNMSNGDTFRWEQVWPTIAEWFGLEPGPPLKVPLAVLMPKHEDTWRAVQQEHDTKIRVPLKEAASFEFGDATFGMEFNFFSNTVKIRQAGFNNHVDSAANFIARLEELAHKGFLPKYGHKHLPGPPDRNLVKSQAQPPGILSPPGSPKSSRSPKGTGSPKKPQ